MTQKGKRKTFVTGPFLKLKQSFLGVVNNVAKSIPTKMSKFILSSQILHIIIYHHLFFLFVKLENSRNSKYNTCGNGYSYSSRLIWPSHPDIQGTSLFPRDDDPSTVAAG